MSLPSVVATAVAQPAPLPIGSAARVTSRSRAPSAIGDSSALSSPGSVSVRSEKRRDTQASRPSSRGSRNWQTTASTSSGNTSLPSGSSGSVVGVIVSRQRCELLRTRRAARCVMSSDARRRRAPARPRPADGSVGRRIGRIRYGSTTYKYTPNLGSAAIDMMKYNIHVLMTYTNTIYMIMYM